MTQDEIKLRENVKALTELVGQLRQALTLFQQHEEDQDQRLDALEAANWARAMDVETSTPPPDWG